jgi:hypothetical protein
MTHYYGLPTRVLSTRHLELEFLAEAGPRLVRLTLKEAHRPENFLAETPHVSWMTPFGEYFVRGGHRLWHAPEAAGRSSIPDSGGLEIEALAGGVRLSQPTELATGIRKSLEVCLHPDRPALTVKHSLENQGMWPVELAPWAITQLALGGVAILPQPTAPLDLHGLQPNRSLVLWPYTRSADPRLEMHDDFWLVHGQPQLPPCKIGYLNRCGWAGYLRQQTLLIKRFQPETDRRHPDWDCNVEVYCSNLCLELETLAPLSVLEPGQSTVHTEQWEFFTDVDIPPTHAGIQTWVNSLAPQWLRGSRLDDLPGAGQTA